MDEARIDEEEALRDGLTGLNAEVLLRGGIVGIGEFGCPASNADQHTEEGTYHRLSRKYRLSRK